MLKIVSLIVFLALIALTVLWLRGSLRSGSSTVVVTIGQQRLHLRVARTALERGQGLRGVRHLGVNTGMVFLFGQPAVQQFTMSGMSVALDFVWVSAGKVVGVDKDAAPEAWTSLRRYSSPAAVDTVIELPAGWVASHGVSVGAGVTVQTKLKGQDA